MLYRGRREPERPLDAVSSGASRVCGYDRETFESGDLSWRDVVHDEDAASMWEDVRAGLDADGTYDVVYRIVTAGGETRWVRERGECLDDGTLSGYVEDVTRLKAREQRLQAELDETLERVSDGFFALDDDWTFTYVNERAGRFLQQSPDDLRGASVWEAFPAALGTTFQTEYERAMAEQEAATFTARFEPLDADFEVNAYPSETGLSVYFRDVTARVERERQLERHETILETVWDGVYALDAEERFSLVNGAYCELMGVDREAVRGRSVEEVLSEDVLAEARQLAEEVVDGERDSATISYTHESGGEERVLEARFGQFSNGGRVGVVRDVTRRRERERQLRRQRERLGELVELYDVASDVSHAVVEQTSRSGVEERVAERLVDGSYAAAWIGRTTGTEVTRVASAGTSDAPVDDVSLATAALREGSVRATTTGTANGEDAERGADWTAAAVPIAYEGGTYGVLVVHARRRDAIETEERTVLARLGTTIGHAIAALDRRAALLSDRVVQVEYATTSGAETVDVPGDGRFEFEGTVPTDDGEYVHYVRVFGLDRETAVGAFERTDFYDLTRVVGERDGDVLLEATSTDAPMTAAVADLGGRLTAVTLADGEMRVTAEFPQGVDLRTATRAVRQAVPDAELRSQRSTTREGGPNGPLLDAYEDLTERQRVAFETAFYGGYFEWPRDSTAEELAETMGVSSATFHQHIRKAERRLLGAYVE